MRMTKRQKAFLEAQCPVPDGPPPQPGEWAIIPQAQANKINPFAKNVLFVFQNGTAAGLAASWMNGRARDRKLHPDRCLVVAMEVK